MHILALKLFIPWQVVQSSFSPLHMYTLIFHANVVSKYWHWRIFWQRNHYRGAHIRTNPVLILFKDNIYPRQTRQINTKCRKSRPDSSLYHIGWCNSLTHNEICQTDVVSCDWPALKRFDRLRVRTSHLDDVTLLKFHVYNQFSHFDYKYMRRWNTIEYIFLCLFIYVYNLNIELSKKTNTNVDNDAEVCYYYNF